jgi:hypothetical protein
MNSVNAVMDVTHQDRAPNATAAPPHKWHRRRITLLLAGLVLVLGSVAMIAAGAFAEAVSSGGTYLDLGAHGTYRTDRYALTTDSTNWRTAWFGWTGTVRVKVAAAGDKPIFVGVTTPGQRDRYLSAASYTTVGEHGRRSEHDGAAPAIPPARAIAWTAYSQGIGTRTLRWNAADGRQVVFAMNADGSPGVSARIVSSEVTLDRMPWWVPAGSLAVGVVLLPIGIVAFLRAIRPRRRVA